MDCTQCLSKGCRKNNACTSDKHLYIEEYANPKNQSITKAASKLVDNGRAGKLNRLEEIIEYCQIRGHNYLGVAYCYGMEKEATTLRKTLKQAGFKLEMVSCTVDGLSETELDKMKTKKTVSCNPLGQTNVLNRKGVQFTILMGLCLGHDVILQNSLKMDHTVFVVKDRVLNNNPIQALPGFISQEDQFLMNLPKDFHLIDSEALNHVLSEKRESATIIDLRPVEQYNKNHIKGAVNSPLNLLITDYRSILKHPDTLTIVYCNGGIQSIYTVMFLAMKGYKNVKSLQGGFSKFLGTYPHKVTPS